MTNKTIEQLKTLFSILILWGYGTAEIESKYRGE